MIAELGLFALVLAWCVSVVMGALPLVPAVVAPGAALPVQRRGAALVFALVLASAVALASCLMSNDFSVRYVASHSHSTLAVGYRLAALWGSHEGSMLLWVLTLAGWTAAVAWRAPGLPDALSTRVMAVLAWILTGLLLFVLLSSNPFVRLLPAPLDGADLNALLQDPGMAFHPPALYLGYVGFAVPFAFAVASLWWGRMNAQTLRWLQPWALLAWAALGVGIVLGSHWAYRVLGWGGWWFWDPVENASLLPWLTGVALLHALVAAQRRGHLQRAVLLLSIAAFGLSLIGTFIVRSGAITSVHAFATDPRRGVFILSLLAISLGGSLWLFALRGGRFGSARPFAALSREALLLCNAMLFAAVAATVLLATLYPMALDALGLAKISVGAPYFEAVLVPLLAPAVFLMGLGPLVQWQRAALPPLLRRIKWAAAAGVLSMLACALLRRPAAAVPLGLFLGLFLGVWALATAGMTRPWRHGAGGRAWGMAAAHAGVGVFVLAVTVLKGFEVEREVPVRVGQQVAIGPYQLRLEALEPFDAPSHEGVRARLALLHEGRVLALLEPESRRFRTQDMTVSSPAVDTGWWRDVYVAMGQPVGADTWGLRVQFKPMMAWVWVGFLMMSAGGVVAALPRRRALALPAVAAGALVTAPSLHAPGGKLP